MKDYHYDLRFVRIIRGHLCDTNFWPIFLSEGRLNWPKWELRKSNSEYFSKI